MRRNWIASWYLTPFLASLIFISACGGGGGGGDGGSPAVATETETQPSVTAETGTLVAEDIFTQPTVSLEKKVDILIVMDTSNSLREERAALAAAVPEILDELEALESYSLGMILGWGSPVATDAYDGSGYLYQVGSYPYVFDSTLDSRADISAGISEVIATDPPIDLSADYGEAGLYSLNQFVTVHSADAKAKGFFREGAALVVIFMSDENDICADFPADVQRVADIEGYEATAFELYCNDADGNRTITAASVYQAVMDFMSGSPVRFTGLVYTGPVVPDGKENEKGYGFLDAIELSGGVAIDLAAPDFLELARNLGNSINALAADLKVRFPLSYGSINPLSIQVLVDGQPENFVYDEVKGEVILNYAGGPGSTIDITYRVLN